MKHKTILLSVLGICLAGCLAFAGCEKSTSLQAASISDISVSGSGNYGIRVSYLQDKRLEDRYVDIQVKADKPVSGMHLWMDGGTKYAFGLPTADSWKSITTIFMEAQGKPKTETFEKFQQAISKRILFSHTEKITLTFRVVVGDVTDNDTGTGMVLTGAEPISDTFTLKVDGKNNNNEQD